MKKSIVITTILLALLLAFFILVDPEPPVTTASVAGFGEAKCVDPAEALKFINEENCTRIYEDPQCAERGLVEIKC